MLKKELFLDSRQLSASRVNFSPLKIIRLRATRLLVVVAAFYSRSVGLRITPRMAFHLLHGQAGAFVALLPFPMNPVIRLLAYAWVVMALISSFSRK